MAWTHTLAGTRWHFADLKTLLARASPARSGDSLAGVAAGSAVERVAARFALADLPLATFLNEAMVPYEADEVTRLIVDTHDAAAFALVAHLTVGALRDWLLSEDATPTVLAALAPGLTPEMTAAVSKLMRNQDLMTVAKKCHVTTAFRNTLGLPGRLAVRLQPNHPTDDLRGIAASMLDGLMYGCGDAMIGINPASDSLAVIGTLLQRLDELIQRHTIPTQACVLTHVTNTLRLMDEGVPVDLVFQSVAGSEAANKGFGIDLALLRQAQQAAAALARGTVGQHAMYFETGQGSALSAGAHHGVDQQTMEARAYGVARAFSPLLTNSVVGFIGPRVPGRRQADHPCGAGRPLLRQAAGLAVGGGHLSHQPRRRRQRRHGHADDVAGSQRRHLHHGCAGGRRHHAELPEHLVPRRGGAARIAGAEARAGIRSVVAAGGHQW